MKDHKVGSLFQNVQERQDVKLNGTWGGEEGRC